MNGGRADKRDPRGGAEEARVEAIMARVRAEARWAYPDHPESIVRQARIVGVLFFVLLGLVLLLAVGLIQKGAPPVEPAQGAELKPPVGSGPLMHALLVQEAPPAFPPAAYPGAVAAAGELLPYHPFWPAMTVNGTLVFGLFGGLVVLLFLRWWFGRSA
ncbi:hypothetical protein AB1399_10790 [Hydrogenibacillus schlegelii]|uniref:Uncharacterized protein n=1 Tax=Hydrogenibacillus schlegelii TaxID=1484 RepID=A0A179IQ39_HYDSH|nr:hypothetical protein [Hydrogenibacillus schlegelii]OAR03731.1 hypothetical protein SA87_00670 [Hydrogenibacillus schlegelii]